MSRRVYESDVSASRYEDRRGPRPRYEDRDPYYDDYQREPARERQREILVREEIRERPRETPAYLREDYGRTEAGPVVLRARETEDFEFVQRPPRPPSPEPEKKVEREEIIIRRREEDERSVAPHRPRERSREREEITITRRHEEDDVRSVAGSRRGGGGGGERSREEIIIRRQEDDGVSRRGARSEIGSDDRYPPPRRTYDDYAPTRPISHERERSRTRKGHGGSDSEQEIIIRQEERGRGERQQEIIIRKTSRSNSPSSVSTRGPAPAPEPPVIHAPPIHQEVITHHRHIDHGFELAIAPRPRAVSRPPSPPSPPRARERSEERIEIRRTGERNGEPYSEELVIDRQEGPARARSPLPPPRDAYEDYAPVPRREPPPAPVPYRGYDRDIQEEAEYYNNRAMDRAYPGEAHNGATRNWGLVDIPPGTERVRMDGQGGGGQEITWQRYNGVRRSKFYPDDRGDGYYPGDLARHQPQAPPLPAPAPVPTPAPAAAPGQLAARFGRPRDPTEGLWTEVTKDLVVKEAIQEMGYEFEESDKFFYIIAYLKYEDMARLVGLSEDIRKDRRKRVREMGWENRVQPEPAPAPRPRPAIEPPPPRPERTWDREDERYIEREIVYRGGRPPPPPGWRR